MKNILIYFPDSITPLTMANRVRVLEKIKFLSKNNSITFLSIISTSKEKEDTVELLKGLCRCEFVVRPKKASIEGILLRIKWIVFDYLGILPHDYLTANGNWVRKTIKKIASEPKQYDCVICDYWYVAASTFSYFSDKSITKIIDTHNVLSEQRVLELDKHRKTLSPAIWLKRYNELEKRNLNTADVLIAISMNDYKYYLANYPAKKIALIPIGIDLNKINHVNMQLGGNTVLFFANLGSQQNIIAFNRLWNNIFPAIKNRIPDSRLLVVGDNPGEQILKLNELDYVNVTGFVDDPLQFARTTKVHIIAMETGSGFRGRIPEVMGIGVPTIGTHNALDCMSFDGELTDFVNDDDNHLAETAIRLMEDKSYWCRMSQQSKKFISENYSLQKTYSKLEHWL